MTDRYAKCNIPGLEHGLLQSRAQVPLSANKLRLIRCALHLEDKARWVLRLTTRGTGTGATSAQSLILGEPIVAFPLLLQVQAGITLDVQPTQQEHMNLILLAAALVLLIAVVVSFRRKWSDRPLDNASHREQEWNTDLWTTRPK